MGVSSALPPRVQIWVANMNTFAPWIQVQEWPWNHLHSLNSIDPKLGLSPVEVKRVMASDKCYYHWYCKVFHGDFHFSWVRSSWLFPSQVQISSKNEVSFRFGKLHVPFSICSQGLNTICLPLNTYPSFSECKHIRWRTGISAMRNFHHSQSKALASWFYSNLKS